VELIPASPKKDELSFAFLGEAIPSLVRKGNEGRLETCL